MPVNAANKQWRLTMLILDIHIDTASNQEFDNMLFIIFAG
jgi:hypothetical protein